VAVFRPDDDHPMGGVWEVTYNDPPLEAFNTLDNIQPGDRVWIYATTDAVLTIP
jgi:hypothetical protein